MSRIKRRTMLLGSALLLGLSVPIGTAEASGNGFKVLSASDGNCGLCDNQAGVIEDQAGNLYGASYDGGPGVGDVFKLAPDGTLTQLYDFTGGGDGGFPKGDLVMDASGNLYGTTSQYGANGYGTVFEVAADGTFSVLYSFAGGSDGAYPAAGLITDQSGNLYGTTERGGANGYGTVFELAPDGTETVLHSFNNSRDGAYPQSRLLADASGNLYGTTSEGGTERSGYEGGTVFKLAPDGTLTVLHRFRRRADGLYPEAGLVADGAGNLYGTTYGGGSHDLGTVFKIAPDGTETVLHAFQHSGKYGEHPQAALAIDGAGNLYGTASAGGFDWRCRGYCAGVAFEISASGTYSVLHAFHSSTDGGTPKADLYLDASGDLIGTTSSGGPNGEGTVFALTPAGARKR